MRVDLAKGIAYVLLPLALALPASGEAQVFGAEEGLEITVGGGVDLVNQYVWRGFVWNGTPNIQPYLWVATEQLEFGGWASHSFDEAFHEQDFWLTYYFPGSRLGNLSLTINDYYENPDFGEDFFDFAGIGPCPEDESGYGTPGRCAQGAHTMEVVGEFSGAAQPIDLLFAYNFHNDPENAMYAEAAFRPLLGPLELRLTVGGVLRDSEWWYETEGTTLTNVSAGVSALLERGRFSAPLAAEVTYNPYFEETYFVARVGIAGEL
ncbi:MAG: hypothetical protein WD737_02185 [Gemmatimonadota bacterium]